MMRRTTTMMKKKEKENPESSLPPGFRFHPTDEELILHYLQKKVASIPFPVSIIADVDIYKFDPWDLPGKATFGEKEWYFFSPRDRKYPNGARPNRAAASGYWKATGTDKIISVPSIIMSSAGGGGHGSSSNIGVKKALVFYKGRPPKGIKTNWIMHEYRLADSPTYSLKPALPKPINKDSSMRLDDWVLCRIYKKYQPNLSHQSATTTTSAVVSSSDPEEEEEVVEEEEEKGEQLQFVQQTHFPLSSSKTSTPLMPQKSSSFSNLLDATDYSLLSSFLSDPQFNFNVPPPESGNNPNDHSHLGSMVNQQQPPCCFGSTSTNGGYLHHKVPQLQYSNGSTTSAGALYNNNNNNNNNGETTMMMMNRLKRERSNGDDHHDEDDHGLMMMMMMNPAKKSMNSCNSFINNNHNHMSNNFNGGDSNNGDRATFHDNMGAPPTPTNHHQEYGLLNQQLLLSHQLQFQG